MTIAQFNAACADFNAGNVTFNHGSRVVAFLYKNKWYPLRAFVKHAIGRNEITTNESRKEVSVLFPYVRVKDNVNFVGCDGFPVPLTPTERLEELRLLNEQLTALIS